MTKEEYKKEFEKNEIDYDFVKKEFELKIKSKKTIFKELLQSIKTKLDAYSTLLMSIYSPKNFIQNYESRMLNNDFKEDLYETLKEISIMKWEIRKEIIKNEEESQIELSKRIIKKYSNELNPKLIKLCNEMIHSWKNEKKKQNHLSF